MLEPCICRDDLDDILKRISAELFVGASPTTIGGGLAKKADSQRP